MSTGFSKNYRLEAGPERIGPAEYKDIADRQFS